MRFTLKEMLAVFVAVSLSFALLRNPSRPAAGATVCMATLLGAAMLTRAFVLRGDARRFAIGFLCLSVAYGAMVYLHRDTELKRMNHWLPTSRMTPTPWPMVMRSGERYLVDGQLTEDAPAGRTLSRFQYNYYFYIAQCCWATLLGYAGGKYAVWIGRTRGAPPPDAAPISER